MKEEGWSGFPGEGGCALTFQPQSRGSEGPCVWKTAISLRWLECNSELSGASAKEFSPLLRPCPHPCGTHTHFLELVGVGF